MVRLAVFTSSVIMATNGNRRFELAWRIQPIKTINIELRDKTAHLRLYFLIKK